MESETATGAETLILDGKKIGSEIRAEVADEIRRLGFSPGLTVILVGDDPASHLYVNSKTKVSRQLGIRGETLRYDSSTTTDELLETVARLNGDDQVDGILVQLPLPRHVDERQVLEAIDPCKDVDGFHPINVGRLCRGDYTLAPCTPMGIMEMLKREGIPIQGAEAVVVGRSNIVGKPMALLLLHQHASVTICHSRTRDLPAVCRRADILIAAVGRPGLIDEAGIKPGAVVVDVGMNRLEDRDEVIRLYGEGSRRLETFDRKGYALAGDVHPRHPYGLASRVTPVPGGVGPLTIAHLMKNTLLAHRMRKGIEK